MTTPTANFRDIPGQLIREVFTVDFIVARMKEMVVRAGAVRRGKAPVKASPLIHCYFISKGNGKGAYT